MIPLSTTEKLRICCVWYRWTELRPGSGAKSRRSASSCGADQWKIHEKTRTTCVCVCRYVAGTGCSTGL